MNKLHKSITRNIFQQLSFVYFLQARNRGGYETALSTSSEEEQVRERQITWFVQRNVFRLLRLSFELTLLFSRSVAFVNNLFPSLLHLNAN